MFNIGENVRVYLAVGKTDMRKGINRLSEMVVGMVKEGLESGAIFVFRGGRADRLKILWWDGQGFCLYYKCMDRGKFTWPNEKESGGTVGITKGQLGMLIEGIDWRSPIWSNMPKYI